MPKTKYKTKQRDEILHFFMDNEDKCMTAREVCSHVSAGEATVFRALSSLTEEGLLKRFNGDSGRGECAYYQINYCSDKHIHLKCEKCGRLIHMDCGFMKNIVDHFKTEHGFMLNCGKTVIYGLCSDCADKNSGGKDIQ